MAVLAVGLTSQRTSQCVQLKPGQLWPSKLGNGETKTAKQTQTKIFTHAFAGAGEKGAPNK